MGVEVAAIEALTPRNGVNLPQVWPLDRSEDRDDVRRHVWTTPRKMPERARVDHDGPTVAICPTMLNGAHGGG